MKKRVTILVLLLAIAGFAYGLKILFEIRFEAGDIYPEYSSLRSDPIGSKALYESLAAAVPTERNYKNILNPDYGRGTTLLLLGVVPRSFRMSSSDMKQLDGLLAKGGRLVIALLPTFEAPKPAPSKFGKKTGPAPAPQPSEPDEAQYFNADERWGFSVGHKGLGGNANKDASEMAFAQPEAPKDLPREISCHTTLFFDKLDPSWRVIYARSNDTAMVIERSFGKGSLLLCSDSWLFSNESLLKERHPALLAWAAGTATRLVFDETHLNVHENTGIATLGRKYGLHGFLLALVLVAGLFVWKSSVSFLPPYQSQSELEMANVVSGKESSEGFINLLRRNIAPGDLLATCLAEWKKSRVERTQLSRLRQVQQVIDAENDAEPRNRNAVRTYRAIAEILSTKSARLSQPQPTQNGNIKL
jgi:hypothetical protein